MSKQTNNRIIVIGGGPAGMMAAITAAECGRSVLLLERNDQCGKKILATGNGRCNYTNLSVSEDCYNSNGDFAMKVMERFDNQAVISFFQKLGVVPRFRGNYVYPFSDQSQAVRQVLTEYMDYLGVQVEKKVFVQSVVKTDEGYKLFTEKKEYFAKKLIIAAGSRAHEKTGSDGSGYGLLRNLSVKINTPLPALTALRTKEPLFKSLAGIRVEGRVSLLEDNRVVAQDTGEIQLTDYGISGIPVFQISGPAVRQIHKKKKALCQIDFLPELDYERAVSYIKARSANNPDTRVYSLFCGLLNSKLSDCLIPVFGVKKDRRAATLTEEEIYRLIDGFKRFLVELTNYNSFDYGQVCQGGAAVEQLDPKTMQVTASPGLFLAGEIVDVDGKCGGYNLQWAFSSGYVAGEAAANDSN